MEPQSDPSCPPDVAALCLGGAAAAGVSFSHSFQCVNEVHVSHRSVRGSALHMQLVCFNVYKDLICIQLTFIYYLILGVSGCINETGIIAFT